ncbi:MAG: proline--tRNA ligase [Candidatus Marsarchaeota archaeon]|nr:proline--tRNA ligase [Candidatus Marsarchaeota archaeon]MCL5413520.1 proline--tRNA ligase [Candidatus Marsarchaeota archaeon]
MVLSLAEKEMVGHINAKKSENFSEWYTQVLIRSGFIDYSEVSGCIIFRPPAYAAWQLVVDATDREFKKDGIDDVYFPLLIPEKLLQKEQEHLKGFTPEVAWVTHTGNTKLDERLAVRPTSETIMYASYSKWIRSWRDLPLRYNQWNNVLRWEFKHPTPFIRSREFLWNEGHSAFASKEDAIAERDRIIKIYLRILKDYLALPGIVGKKTDSEKFAGAVESYSIEHIMPDGLALQGPDHHFDGQNFSKPFEIKFLDKDGAWDYAWQTTYAISTREFGVMVATHGDDKGLVIPPKLAYLQVVIVPIYRKDNKEAVNQYSSNVYGVLNMHFRTRLDDREGYSPGFKYNEWEMKGVPIRIEIGERDMSANMVTVIRRDTGEKQQVNVNDIHSKVANLLEEIHSNLYENAVRFLNDHVHVANTYDEFKKILKEKGGIITAPWCGSAGCEARMKEENGTKITNLPLEHEKVADKCIYCGKESGIAANFARSY